MRVPCKVCETWTSSWPHCDGFVEVPDPPTRVVNRYVELYDVYIGRPSKWGNPFKPANKTLQARRIAILRYEEYIIDCPELFAALHELKGKRLGCYCKPKPCHGDVLVGLVERFVSQEVV